MTVLALGAPRHLSVTLRSDGIKCSWEAPERAATIENYKVQAQWFDPESPMIEPTKTETLTLPGQQMVVHVPHTPDVRMRACTLKLCVAAENSDSRGVTASRFISWDDTLPEEKGQPDLEARHAELASACNEFVTRRGVQQVRVLVVGGQHHGKSSLVNHVYRCLHKDMNRTDQMESAPAGYAENTQETKALPIPFGEFCFVCVDTPAFSSVTQEKGSLLNALLSNGIPEGTRRMDFGTAQQWLRTPPDAAVVVVSLMHWRDQQEEVKEYLRAISARLKNASQGRVAFPYVVAATCRDEFLLECQSPNPHEMLENARSAIKQHANTDKVFVLANYKQVSKWSRAINMETFGLLRDIVTLAKNQDTGRVVKENQNFVATSICSAVVVAVVVVGLAALCKSIR
eukprot:CAMPEP_0179124118 /NCGR_PEP_ID=MMETSP0796-20121207/58639_1 /TAXON_ID=73915 /ORGANISM="Pyrodinium bahamense, Strain pbaha01" /LENGTH=400 /DNA_ID=CAMNT_0020822767 /DNA_START=32 /DNA_END=1234 /DNA_ORIENTATION=-